jgi:hypothetical protein
MLPDVANPKDPDIFIRTGAVAGDDVGDDVGITVNILIREHFA